MTQTEHLQPHATALTKSIRRLAERLPQPLRYLLVGGTAYIIEMASLLFLRRILGWRPLAAVAISFWIGFVVAFLLQKTVAFQNYERDRQALTRQMVGYAALVAFNYVVTLLIVRGLERYVAVEVLRTGVIAITTIWNYVLYKHLFKMRQHGALTE